MKTINGWTKKLMKAQIRLNMKFKAINENGNCRYRVEGSACAVGCFLPDKYYSVSLEGKSPASRAFQFLTKGVKWPLFLEDMEKMQRVHDYYYSDLSNPATEVCEWIDNNVEDGE